MSDKIWAKAVIELVQTSTGDRTTTELRLSLFEQGDSSPVAWKNEGFRNLPSEDNSVLLNMSRRDAEKFVKLGFAVEGPTKFVATNPPNGLVLKAWKLINKGDNEVVEHFVGRSRKKGRSTDDDFDDNGKKKKGR